MEKAERIIKYFCSQLEIKNHEIQELIAVLTVLVELFDRDVDELLKNCAKTLKLHKHLIDILNKPCQYWQHKSRENEITGDSVVTDGSSQVADKVAVDGDKRCCYFNESQSNSIDFGNSTHPLTYTLAMKCLHSLCTFNKVHHLQFVDRQLIRTLVTYLSPKPSFENQTRWTHFYQFDARFTALFKDTLELCDGKVKIMCSLQSDENSYLTELLSFYEPDYLCQGYASKQLQDIRLCSIKLKLSDKEVNVVDVLISQQCAWKPFSLSDRKSEEVGQKNEEMTKQQTEKFDQWVDVSVTHILKGNFLWVQLGWQCMHAAVELTKVLQSRRNQLVKTTAVHNDLVAVHIGNKDEIIRARVTVITATTVTVFDIDTGRVHRVPAHLLFCLPSDLHLSHIPALATLVCLQGVLPVPLDVRTVELAAASLAHICRFGEQTRVMIMEEISSSCGVPDLIVCPDLQVAQQSLHLVTNLLLGTGVKWSMKWQHIFMATLETLKKCVESSLVHYKHPVALSVETSTDQNRMGEAHMQTFISLSDKQRKQINVQQKIPDTSSTISRYQNKYLTLACLHLLVNRLYLSMEAKCLFYKLAGVSTLVRAYLIHIHDNRIRMGSAAVLCNFVYCSPSTTTAFRECETYMKQSSRSSISAPMMSHISSQGKERDDDASVGTGQVAGHLLTRILRGLGHGLSAGLRYQMSDMLGRIDQDIPTGLGRGLSTGLDQPMSHLVDKKRDEDMPDTDFQRCYIQGSCAPVHADSRHDMYETRQISADYLACILCGMLNQGYGGTVYIGINESGVITGEYMSSNIRDQIRLGVDNIMSQKLIPAVLHSQYQVTFVPVRDGQEHVVASRDLYVVELSCRPVPGIMYSCHGCRCYYRVGVRTMALKAEDIRHMIALEEEGLYEQQLNNLLVQLRCLKAEECQLLTDAGGIEG